MLFKRGRAKSLSTDGQPLRCSFCNKEQDEVEKLIAGPAVFICDECVHVCNEILADDARIPARGGGAAVGATVAAPPPVEPTTRIVTCTLCGMRLPWEEGLPVPERGVLCPGCTGAIETALAEKGDASP
jgi:hypothetical protein